MRKIAALMVSTWQIYLPTVQVTTASYSLDLQHLINKYAERYAGWIANNIIDSVFSGLRGFKPAVIVGGGTVLTEAYLRK